MLATASIVSMKSKRPSQRQNAVIDCSIVVKTAIKLVEKRVIVSA